jgi:ketosteroid isomerase-like protein
MESGSGDTEGAMSEENVELVKRMYDAYRARDAEKALSYFAPDVLVDASTLRPDIGEGHGREHVAAVVTSWTEPWEDWHEENEEIRDLGDAVLVISLQRGRGKGSGIEIESRFTLLYEVRDGQITAMRMYGSTSDALEAAGLSE